MEIRAMSFSVGVATGLTVTFLGVWSYWCWRKSTMQRILPQKYKKVAKVVKVIIYPIKALPGIELENATCTAAGIRFGNVYDRMWMIVTDRRDIVALKLEPTLTLLRLSLHDDQIWVDGPDMSTLKLDIMPSSSDANRKEGIYNSFCGPIKAIECKKEETEWFQKYLGRTDVTLVRHPLQFPKNSMRDKGITKTARALGLPLTLQNESSYHLLSLPSLEFLSSQFQEPVSFLRFRPNIVVDGCKPHEEDAWNYVKFNKSAVLYFLAPCVRCHATTIDPDTGKRTEEYQPLTTLRKYRLGPNPDARSSYPVAPAFGVRLGLAIEGVVHVGDDVSAGFGA